MNLDYFCHIFVKNSDRMFRPVWAGCKFVAVDGELRLGRVTGLLPGGESAQQRGDADELVLEQDERRTGAGFFRWSGAVGDNPGVFYPVRLFGQAVRWQGC